MDSADMNVQTTSAMNRSRLTVIGWASLLLALAQPAYASYEQLDISGTLAYIQTQTGAGVYAGVQLNAPVTGMIRYGSSASEGTVIVDTPTVRTWLFDAPTHYTSFTVDGVTLGGSTSQIEIANEYELTQEDVDDLAIRGITATVGQKVDYWGSPNDGDNLQFGGQEWGFGILDLDATMLSGLDYLSDPSVLVGADLVILNIWDTLADQTELFYGTALIDSTSTSTVPLPASGWFLISGVLGIFGILKRRATA